MPLSCASTRGRYSRIVGVTLLVDNIDGHVIYFCDEAARVDIRDDKISIDLLLACMLFLLK